MKTKQIILTIALLFSTLLINAQDKYEFMIIAYFPQAQLLTVSLNGKEVIYEKVEAEKYERLAGNHLLKKVNEYQDKNWELVTFTNASAGQYGNQEFYAYLKRKK